MPGASLANRKDVSKKVQYFSGTRVRIVNGIDPNSCQEMWRGEAEPPRKISNDATSKYSQKLNVRTEHL
jgi:hypothetical protein